MARTINDQGEWIEVPDPVPAVAPIQPTGRTVTLIDDTGSARTIDEAEAGLALQAGWREETPEEFAARTEAEQYGGFGEQVEGTLEEVARVGSFGLSDPIITGALEATKGQEFADAERARMAARQRQLGTVGKVAGTVGGLGLSAGLGLGRAGLAAEGLVGRGLARAGLGGTGVAASALGAGAKLAAGGAVEGGLFGAGQALSEAALEPGGNYDNLASRLVAGGKQGAGFGAGAGAFLGVGGGALGALGRKGLGYLTGPAGLKKTLERFAEERAFKTLNPRISDVQRLGRTGAEAETKLHTMAREMLDGQLDDGTRIFRAGIKAEDLTGNLQRASRETGKKLDSLRESVFEAEESALASGAYRSTAVDPDALRFLGAVEKQVLAPLSKSLSPTVRSKADDVVRELSTLRGLVESGERVTLRDLTKFRMELDDIIRPRPVGPGLRPLPPAHVAELESVRRLLEDTIEDGIERVAKDIDPKTLGLYRELKKRYGSYATAKAIAEKSSVRDLRNRWAQPSDYGTGVATAAGIIGGGASALGGLATGAAVAMGHKILRERGSSTIAVLAGKLARYDGRMNAGISKFFSAAAPRRALGVGARADVAEQTGRTRDAMRARESETLADGYRKRLKEIQGWNPASMDEDVGQIAKAAPGTATGYAARQARARKFLLSKAPRELLGDDPIQAHIKPAVPSRPELEKFSRYLRTVEDPLSVLDDLNRGRLSREQVETLKVVDPGVYEDLQTRVMEKLGDTTERLPYLKRVQLGMLLEIPTDPSLQPGRVRMSQELYAQAPAVPAPGPSAKPGAMSRAVASPSQSLEAGMVEF